MHRRTLLIASLICLALLLMVLPQLISAQEAPPPATAAERSWPHDTNDYTRATVPEDLSMEAGLVIPGVLLRDVVVSNTNPNLTNTDTANDGETSIAINPANPDEIVISSFSGSWGANAPIYHSTDGGLTWTRQLSVAAPPGWPGGCPCDWAFDYGRNNQLSAAILANSPTVAGGVDVVSGTTTNPALSASWGYFDPAGTPVQAQETNINWGGSLGNADQPWLLANRDPVTAAQDNVYVAYDDFNNTDGVDGPDMRVAVSYGQNPPNFTVDSAAGNALGGVNPGLRLADDSRTGVMWVLWGRNTGNGDDDSKRMDYMLNRSTDGGANWTLNASTTGIVVATADSTQPRPKFGTVNALLGGVHHAGTDPVTGDLYYVYGNRDSGTNQDRLAIRRISSNGAGGVNIGPESFVTGQVEAAIPSVAVNSAGVVGVFYYTFDGFSSDEFPIFTAHLAVSDDQGATFDDTTLLTFLSSAKDDGVANSRQRVLGDYMQMKAVDTCFYGSFTGNGAPLGRPFANHDPIFFKVCTGPQVQTPNDLIFGGVCAQETQAQTLNVCNTGTQTLVVNSVTSSNPTIFPVTQPNPGFPVNISPDFCFPFEVQFNPTSGGVQNATLTVNSNDPINPALTVNTSGEGTLPLATTSGELSFGQMCGGQSQSLSVKVCNTGFCNLNVTGAQLVGPDCDDLTLVSPNPAPTLANPLQVSHDFCFDFVVKFEPNDLTPPQCALQVNTDDTLNPILSFPINASVGAPDLVLDPPALTGAYSFPPTVADPAGTLGCFSDRNMVLRNVGTCPATITNISTSGAPFSVFAPTQFPLILPPGQETLNVTVRMRPTSGGLPVDAPGETLGSLTVTSDDPAGPQAGQLCGEVVAGSGGRWLVVNNNDVPIGNVDQLTLTSSGINTPKPIAVRSKDVPVQSTTVCGETVTYHLQLENLPSTSTTGSNPKSSYSIRAKEGNKQVTKSFTLGFCEFKQDVLKLR